MTEAVEPTSPAAQAKPQYAPDQLMRSLLRLFDLEDAGDDSFRVPGQNKHRERMFGGQVIAQTLVAAARTVESDRRLHSLHAYFMRAGNEALETRFDVSRDFDGRRFATRCAVAIQDDKPILSMASSFQVQTSGLSHQAPMPDVPPPEDLPTDLERMIALGDKVPQKAREWAERPRAVMTRSVEGRGPFGGGEPVYRHHMWLRAAGPIPDEPVLHQAVIAFASDMGLLGTSLMAHAINWNTPGLRSASLDHAIWFHEPARADDDWLLYAMESDWTGGGRGHNRGRIYSRDGRLIASTTQEAMIDYAPS